MLFPFLLTFPAMFSRLFRLLGIRFVSDIALNDEGFSENPGHAVLELGHSCCSVVQAQSNEAGSCAQIFGRTWAAMFVK